MNHKAFRLVGAVMRDLLNPDTLRVSWCKQQNTSQYQLRNLNQRDHPTSPELADRLAHYLLRASRLSMHDTTESHLIYRCLIHPKFRKRS